jgi:hypothetical protein
MDRNGLLRAEMRIPKGFRDRVLLGCLGVYECGFTTRLQFDVFYAAKMKKRKGVPKQTSPLFDGKAGDAAVAAMARPAAAVAAAVIEESDDAATRRAAARVGLSLPGVRLVTNHGPYWLSSIETCFDCEIAW